jgi:hypothetical protein
MEIPQIAQAAVSTCEDRSGFVEIVAYYSSLRLRLAAQRDRAGAWSRRLPPYMVPPS